MSIIAVGDIFQLTPIRGHNHLLWHMFQPIFLRENVHQAYDHSDVRVINHARIGVLVDSDIDSLKQRLIDPNHQDVPETLHVYPTRN